MRPLLGTWPTTQACALTGNWTSDPLVRRPTLNPVNYTSQGLSPRIFIVCILHISLWPFWLNFCEACNVCGKAHLVACGVHFFQHHFLRRLPLPHWIAFAQRLADYIPAGLFLGFLFCCTDLLVCFLSTPYCLDYCSFIVSLEFG